MTTSKKEEEMMRHPCRPAVFAVALVALGGCSDGPAGPELPSGLPIEGPPGTPAHPGFAAHASVVIHDVIHRIVPVAETGGATDALRAELVALLASIEVEDGREAGRSLSRVAAELERYERVAGDAFAPEAAAIRLAIASLDAAD